MSAATFLLVCLAGGAGAAARAGVDDALRRRLPGGSAVPTLAVNVTGSLLLGLLTGALLARHGAADVRAVLGTGFCGGYTTFSTAVVETLRRARDGRPLAALGHGAGSLLLTTAAAGAGLLAGHLL